MEENGQQIGWATRLHGHIKKAGVRQVSFVPDGGHKTLIQHCLEDPEMRTISLTTEQDGFGLATGAWLGGVRSALLMQSSGVGNCINAISLIRNCQIPFITFVTMRGDFGETNAWQIPMGQGTQPAFEAMGMICLRAETADEVDDVARAGLAMAFNAQQAVAVLLSQRLIGAKTFK